MNFNQVWTEFLRWNKATEHTRAIGQIHPIGTGTTASGTFLEVDEHHELQVVAVHGHCASAATAFAVWTLHLRGNQAPTNS